MSVVAIGSYDSFLSGWEFTEEEGAIKSKQMFGFKVQKNCIKTIAVNNKYLALGGTDDIVRLYDLEKRKEICILMDHNGTINKIVLFGNRMVCASDDGGVSYYKITKTAVELIHKTFVIAGGVIDIAVDGTGKVCLCVGKKSMKVVDLYRDKVAFETKLDYEPEAINWVKDDEYFAISHRNEITIYNRNFEEYKVLQCEDKQLIRVTTSFGTRLIAGTDKGDIISWDFAEDDDDGKEDSKEHPTKDVIHVADGRIRGLENVIISEDWMGYAVGFSDGKFIIINIDGTVTLEMNTGLRITALGATSY